MGVVRETYQDCVLVKKILRNLMVKYEERDVFMSRETQAEIRERMGTDVIVVPQVFVEGQHVGVGICNSENFTLSCFPSSFRDHNE
jgi:glutaredoxin domain-containing cysteine-rich protein 1